MKQEALTPEEFKQHQDISIIIGSAGTIIIGISMIAPIQVQITLTALGLAIFILGANQLKYMQTKEYMFKHFKRKEE